MERSKVDLKSDDYNVLKSRYLVNDILQANIERTTNMKKIEPVKRKTPGMMHVNKTNIKNIAQGYNPVHGIKEEQPSYSSKS